MTMVTAQSLRLGDEILFGMHTETVKYVENTGRERLAVHTNRTQPARPHRYLPLEKVELVRHGDGREPETAEDPERPPAQVVQMAPLEAPPLSGIIKGPPLVDTREQGGLAQPGDPAAESYPNRKSAHTIWDDPGRRFRLHARPYLAVGYFGDDAILYSKKPDGERIFITYLRHEEMLTLIHVYHSEED
jgi:hypothetical protein